MDKQTLEDVIKTFQIGGETFIKIKTPENSAPPLRYGEVTEYVKGLKIGNIDYAAVKRAYKKCRGQSVCIGGGSEDGALPDPDPYTLEVSDDAMLCHLTLLPPSETGGRPESSEIIEAMKLKKIIFGLQESNIRDALERGVFKKPIIAAKGVYPKAGRDAEVKLIEGLFCNIRAFRPESSSLERFRKSSFIRPVKESEQIAWRKKESAGENGRTVFGEELATLPGVPLSGPNSNTFMSEKEVFANIEGHVVEGDSGISVEPLLTLKNATNKRVVHRGSVKILGDVESCPLIEASGDVEIHGTVNNTRIEAGRNIIIHGNLFTKQDKPIVAGKDFSGQNISNAAITAENIIITSTSFNCILTAYRSIQNTGSEGKVVGGEAYAGLALFAATLGSNTNIPTEISVATRDIFDKHRKSILGYYTEKINKLNNHLVLLEKQWENLELLIRGVAKGRGAIYKALTKELKARMDLDEFKIIKLQERLTGIKAQALDGVGVKGELLADKIFPNTSISLGAKKMVLNETRSNIRVQIEEREMVINTFHRNSLKW